MRLSLHPRGYQSVSKPAEPQWELPSLGFNACHSCHIILDTLRLFRSQWSPGQLLIFIFILFYFFFAFSFRAALKTYGSSQLRGGLELWLPAYTTATATRDLSRVCDLHHGSRQCRIPTPLSKARDRTCIIMDPIAPQWELPYLYFKNRRNAKIKVIKVMLYFKHLCFKHESF